MHRGQRALLVLPLLLASLTTAALAHVVIGYLGALGIGGHAYTEHAHDGLGLALLTDGAVLVTSLLVVVANAAARRSQRDPVELLVRRFKNVSAAPMAVIVAAGGLAGLTAIELFEQATTFGHVTGIGDALGGSVLLGLAVVVAIASLTTILELRLVRAFATTLACVVVAFLMWVDAARSRDVDRAARSRDERRLRRWSRTAYLVRGLGLRAPPHLA